MSYTTIKTCTNDTIPSDPSVGDILFNTDTKTLLVRAESGWKKAEYDFIHDTSGPIGLSIQWFEKNEDGDLVLRNESFNSQGPAIEFWEEVNSTDYSPRESDYETQETNIQYFEDINQDITPRINPS